eukprot:TRINITY_DN9143_c0_g1_i2.p1 TRINITY_DN9143_c0_g1~~TRINITY_DN9143_c0_g1_i2.p1  ORF type:complete len:104 (+),score=18.56 TRINITY_DN9143_c0_g1_i2:71-382(+)
MKDFLEKLQVRTSSTSKTSAASSLGWEDVLHSAVRAAAKSKVSSCETRLPSLLNSASTMPPKSQARHENSCPSPTGARVRADVLVRFDERYLQYERWSMNCRR